MRGSVAWRRAAPFVSAAMFVVALIVLRHELQLHSYHDLLAGLRSLPRGRLVAAIGVAMCGYALQSLYDTLGLRYARHALPYRRTALASFIGYAFSNTLGHSLLTGGSIRFRLYSAWGLAAPTITRVIAFCSLSFWLGFLAVAGVVQVVSPVVLPTGNGLLGVAPRVVGSLMLVAVAAYLAASVLRKRPLMLHGFEFSLPGPRLAFAQLGLSVLDWLAAAATLYLLLPDSRVPLLAFLAAFQVAQLVGVGSQVPGGLGVFETSMVVLMSSHLPAAATLGALISYRFIYYLCPLVTAAMLLAAHEGMRQREGLKRIGRTVAATAPRLVPPVMAGLCFLGGIILLVSGATPGVRGRMALLVTLIPIPLVELSHFLGSLAGVGLLIIAWGLRRRLDGAWLLACLLLGGGIAVSLLKGLDWEEALVLSVFLLILAPTRRHFYRTASILHEPLSPSWIAGNAAAVAGVAWLGFFAYRHVEYANELWWQFELQRDAPRVLRAAAGVAGLVVVFGVLRLLRAVPPRRSASVAEDRDRVRSVVASFPAVWANLVYLGDKRLLWSASGRSFVMYAIEGRSWVALGGPVGPPDERVEMVWAFRQLVDRHAGWTVFYEAAREDLDLCLDLGLTVVKLGEEARVPLAGFSLEGHDRKWLRHVDRRLTGEGAVFEIVPASAVPSILDEMKTVSDQWLASRNTREKGFSLGRFDPDYLSEFPAATVRRGGRLLAFANLWLAGREELSPDLMRYVDDATNGTMEFLMIRLMLWGRDQGYRAFNLGMAPLSGMPGGALAPLWSRIGGLVFRRGEFFYNFQGLRRYKEKFSPEWQPRYLACPGGVVLPRALSNVAALVSGGLKGVVGK